MLQRIRDSLQAQKWFAYTILGVLALVFAAWGVYGLVDFGMGAVTYAAKVEDETISMDEARNAWLREQNAWQQRFRREMTPEEQKSLQEQTLEAQVRDVLLTAHARELGYRVTDAKLAEAIRNLPAFQVDGRYSPDVAKAVLAQVGMSVPAFEVEMRREMLRTQLQNAIGNSDFLTSRELERLRALANEEREVRYLILPAEKYAGAQVEDEAVKAYYEQHRDEFLTPESVHLQYGELRLQQLAAQAPIAESDLRKEYERTKDQYVEPEKRRARHILVATEAGKDDAALLKEAEELAARAQKGEDFAALAREHSDDTGSAAQGGDLGWAERSYFVAPFSDALFSMSPGEIRGPVKTEFGYHIIKLEEVQPGRTRSFEEARAEIESRLRQDWAIERLGDVHEQLERKIGEPGADFDALVQEFGLQAGEVSEFLRGGGGAPLGSDPELQDLVFSSEVLDERRIGGPLALGEDRLIIVKVLEHRERAPKPLEQVRDQIVAAIRKERGTAAALEQAEAARERLESGTPFETVAKDLGVDAAPARFVGRGDPSLPAQIRETVFEAPKPNGERPIVRAFALDEGGAALVALTGVRVPETPENPQVAAFQAQQWLFSHGVGDVAAYVEELRRTARVKKNPQAFQ